MHATHYTHDVVEAHVQYTYIYTYELVWCCAFTYSSDEHKTFRPQRLTPVTKQFCNWWRPSWSKHLTIVTVHCFYVKAQYHSSSHHTLLTSTQYTYYHHKQWSPLKVGSCGWTLHDGVPLYSRHACVQMHLQIMEQWLGPWSLHIHFIHKQIHNSVCWLAWQWLGSITWHPRYPVDGAQLWQSNPPQHNAIHQKIPLEWYQRITG